MAKKILRGGAMLAPVPAVMVTSGDENERNILTVAWCGTLCTIPPKTYISVRPSRHSYEIIKRTGEFVIHLVPASLARAADYCGTYTGAKVDKFEKCHLTAEKCENVRAPRIAECPVAIECRVTDIIPLGSHDMFMADVLSVDADEELFDENGALRMERTDLCAYVHGAYYSLGKKIGNFGFSAVKNGKKKKKPEQKTPAPEKNGGNYKTNGKRKD